MGIETLYNFKTRASSNSTLVRIVGSLWNINYIFSGMMTEGNLKVVNLTAHVDSVKTFFDNKILFLLFSSAKRTGKRTSSRSSSLVSFQKITALNC